MRQTISPVNKIKREFDRHKTINDKIQKQDTDQSPTKDKQGLKRDKSDARASEDDECKSNKESKSPAKSAAKPGLGKDNKANKVRKPKLIANVHFTKYPIVRTVLRKEYKMRLYEEDFEDFDLLWCDHVLANDRIMRMKPYQRINHFPGMQALYRKNCLGQNLNLMKQLHPAEFNFYPQTWLLPREAKKLK